MSKRGRERKRGKLKAVILNVVLQWGGVSGILSTCISPVQQLVKLITRWPMITFQLFYFFYQVTLFWWSLLEILLTISNLQLYVNLLSLEY